MPDLPGCQTHGATYEEAARKGQEAVDSWVAAVLAGGQSLPAPASMGIGEQFEPLSRLLAEDPVVDWAGSPAAGAAPGGAADATERAAGVAPRTR